VSVYSGAWIPAGFQLILHDEYPAELDKFSRGRTMKEAKIPSKNIDLNHLIFS
jgi:hypothetical protein